MTRFVPLEQLSPGQGPISPGQGPTEQQAPILRGRFTPLQEEEGPPTLAQAAKRSARGALEWIGKFGQRQLETGIPFIGMLSKPNLEGFRAGLTQTLGGAPQLLGVKIEKPEVPEGGGLGYALGRMSPYLIGGATTLPGMIASGATFGLAEHREEAPPTDKAPVLTGGLIPGGPATAAAAGGAAASAAVGGILKGIPLVFGRLLDKIRKGQPLSAADESLKNLARDKYGIELTPGGISGSEFARRLEAQAEKIPGSARIARKAREKAQEDYTAAIAGEIGETGARSLDAKVRASARKRIGKVYDDLGAKSRIEEGTPAASVLRGGLSRTLNKYNLLLGVSRRKLIGQYATEIEGELFNKGAISGETFQLTFSELRDLQRKAKNKYFRDALGGLINSMKESAKKVLSPEDVAKWELTDRQYSTYKTVAPIAAKSPSGYLSPALVHNKVISKYGEAQKAGRLGELAEIGKVFLTAPSTSGTAENLAAQGLLTGKMGLVGTAGMTGLIDPATAAGLGASLWAVPKVVSSAWYQTPAWQRALKIGRYQRGVAATAATPLGTQLFTGE